jgi:anaerobic ribonucleoside-triphosphate reductase activating protein
MTRETQRALARADAVNVAMTVPRTEVEGPGARFALWVQGCPMRCPGCCNPHLLPFEEAAWRSIDEVVGWVTQTPDIEGLTLIGGEPFSQAIALAEVARRVRDAGLSVMAFTGYTIERLRDDKPLGAAALLAQCDIVVDGPYVEAQASRKRRYIGSDNQRVFILSERYASLRGDAWPRGDDGLELRWDGTSLSVNGYPHPELQRLIERGLRFVG